MQPCSGASMTADAAGMREAPRPGEIRSYDIPVVDANGEVLEKSFARFQRPGIRQRDRNVAPPYLWLSSRRRYSAVHARRDAALGGGGIDVPSCRSVAERYGAADPGGGGGFAADVGDGEFSADGGDIGVAARITHGEAGAGGGTGCEGRVAEGFRGPGAAGGWRFNDPAESKCPLTSAQSANSAKPSKP